MVGEMIKELNLLQERQSEGEFGGDQGAVTIDGWLVPKSGPITMERPQVPVQQAVNSGSTWGTQAQVPVQQAVDSVSTWDAQPQVPVQQAGFKYPGPATGWTADGVDMTKGYGEW